MNVRKSGPASEAELFDVLRWIASAGCDTSLVVCDGISERIFQFAQSRVSVLRSGPRRSATIGSVLVDECGLTPDRLDEIVVACRETGRRFGEAAVDLGLVTYADVAAAIRIKVEEEIQDVFFWPGAEFRLLQGEPPKSYRDGRYHAASHDCDVAAFIDAALARVAQRRTGVGRLPTGQEVYRLDDFADLSGHSEAVVDLLHEFDGTRMASDVVESSTMRRSPAWESLLAAEQAGQLHRLPSADVQDLISSAAAREIETLEELLDRAVDTSIARMRLARACERMARLPRAASHWRQAGDELRELGDLHRALTCYENCTRLAPMDFGAREQVLAIHHHRREFSKVVADGRPLAELFVKHNLLNRAKRLLLQLVAIEPKDAALRRQLIAVLIGLGESGVALHHQRELATVLESSGASSDEILDVYLHVLAVDAKDAKAKSCIDRLTGVAAQRRTVWTTAVVTVALLAAFGGAFVYEAAAREAFGRKVADIETSLAAEEFESARETLESVAAEHPYSYSAWRMRGLGGQIQSLAAAANPVTPVAQADNAQARAQMRNESDASSRLATIRTLIAAGSAADAAAAIHGLLVDLGSTAAVRTSDIRASLPLDVLPSTATVFIDDVEVDRTSPSISYDPVLGTALRIEAAGFVTHEIVLDRQHLADHASDEKHGETLPLRVSLAPPLEWEYWSNAELAASPLVDGETVFVAGRDRRVVALSLADGSELWSAPMGFYAGVSVQPVRVDSGIVVATEAGDVVCLDAATGQRVWTRSLGAPISAQPVATRGPGGLVVVAGGDGRLMGLAQRDGATRWDLGPQTIAAGTAPQLFDASTFVYVGKVRGLAVARLGDGIPALRATRNTGLVTTPAVELGRVWAALRDGSLGLISTVDDQPPVVFEAPTGTALKPCLVGDIAYAACRRGAVIAYRVSGETLFNVSLPEVAGATPIQSEGVLYVPGSERRLHALDSTTGTQLWSLDCGSAQSAQPIIAGNRMLVPTTGGRLIAVRLPSAAR